MEGADGGFVTAPLHDYVPRSPHVLQPASAPRPEAVGRCPPTSPPCCWVPLFCTSQTVSFQSRSCWGSTACAQAAKAGEQPGPGASVTHVLEQPCQGLHRGTAAGVSPLATGTNCCRRGGDYSLKLCAGKSQEQRWLAQSSCREKSCTHSPGSRREPSAFPSPHTPGTHTHPPACSPCSPVACPRCFGPPSAPADPLRLEGAAPAFHLWTNRSTDLCSQ